MAHGHGVSKHLSRRELMTWWRVGKRLTIKSMELGQGIRTAWNGNVMAERHNEQLGVLFPLQGQCYFNLQQKIIRACTFMSHFDALQSRLERTMVSAGCKVNYGAQLEIFLKDNLRPASPFTVSHSEQIGEGGGTSAVRKLYLREYDHRHAGAANTIEKAFVPRYTHRQTNLV